MNFNLSLIVWLPFLVGVCLLFWRRRTGRNDAFIVSIVTLLWVLGLAISYKPNAGFQFVERYDWLRSIGLEYHLAIDGISLVFLLLCAFVFVISIAACRWFEGDNRFYGLILLLQSGLSGTFCAQNFLHFFFFWEVSLIPAFFLVKLYGGANRNFAALQFFIYTMVGSIGMLLAFLAIGFKVGSFDFAQLATAKNGGIGSAIAWTGLTPNRAGILLFLLAFAGVAVKVPLWPFHSWQPLTYVEAPTPVTMILTGVMSKMGVYALLRVILPIFPDQIEALHRPLLALAVITILYGAWTAFGQRDIKRLFAYSSLSHLGYCFLGVFAAARAGVAGLENERAAAINGVILQALSHGVLAAAIFAFILFLERRTNGLRSFESFGGLRKVNPAFAGLMGIAVFASLGLPGLSGFPGEFLIFKGAFSFAPLACAFAVLGLLLTAIYLLTFFEQVFLGPLNEKRTTSAEITLPEKAIVVPAIVVAFVLGLAPQLVVALFNPTVTTIVQQLR